MLGPDYLITDPAQLERVGSATFSTSHSVSAILKPATREQVQECLRIASDTGTPVYPVSTGKNWGYGSSAPTSDACLMDLSRMNRILDFSEEFGYVTVEPGVTQQQLYDFLRERNSSLWIDATGASPDCSILGNTLERGFGHTPYGDHFANVCGLEVVLATGEILDTGFSRFPGVKAGPLYRWGVGPVLDGLFSQSNLGVVTRMTVWLMPAPEYFQAFFFRCDSESDLAPLIDALRPLRMNGTLRSTMHVANDYKVISGIQLYPWSEMNGETPLGTHRLPEFRKRFNCGAWNGSGGLYGTKGQVAEARRLVKQALRGKVSKLQFLDDSRLEMAARFAKPYSMITGWDLSRSLELVRPVYGLMKGVPTGQPLKSCYWRKKAVPENPDLERDGCGLLWCSPIGPASGSHGIAISEIAYRILLPRGFEPMMSITLLTERTISAVISISYDRALPGEDDRAMECYHELLRELSANGYLPYRLGVQSMEMMANGGGYNDLLRALKQTLDPQGVLSPGRYEPASTAARERELTFQAAPKS